MNGVRRNHTGPCERGVLACLIVVLVCGLLACGGGAQERRDRIYELKIDPSAADLEEIRGFLEDENRDVRATALYALVGLRVPDALELATSDMNDPDGFVRSTAAKCLGDLGDAASVPVLAGHLAGDEDWHVRQRAAEALEAIGGDDAVKALGPGLEDPVKEVRWAAVRALGTVGSAPYVDALAGLAWSDPEWEIRAQAASALGASGLPEAVEYLETVANDPNEYVRAAAARALRDLQ